MNLRTPVRRLVLLTGGTAVALVALVVAMSSLDPDSGAHGVVAVSGMVVALALVGFAWALASAALAERRLRK
jgi:Na+/melibiose symporter-like transporter